MTSTTARLHYLTYSTHLHPTLPVLCFRISVSVARTARARTLNTTFRKETSSCQPPRWGHDTTSSARSRSARISRGPSSSTKTNATHATCRESRTNRLKRGPRRRPPSASLTSLSTQTTTCKHVEHTFVLHFVWLNPLFFACATGGGHCLLFVRLGVVFVGVPSERIDPCSGVSLPSSSLCCGAFAFNRRPFASTPEFQVRQRAWGLFRRGRSVLDPVISVWA